MTQSSIDSISLICPSCGYDLRAIPSERCPECGTPIDRTAMAVSTIPWVHRKAIGRVRAYWRTLILATFRIRKLGEEIDRPVDLREASRFRWITIAIASVLPIAVFVVAVCVNRGTGFLDFLSAVSPNGTITVPPQADVVLPYAAGITRWIVLPLAAIAWLGMVSGLAGFWFHPRAKPRWQSDRALGLSWYACAPILWFTLAFAMWAFGAMAMAAQDNNGLIQQPSLKSLIVIGAGTGVVLACVVALIAWINLFRLIGFTLHPGMLRTISLAMGWPIACYVSGILAFGLFPWIAGLIWLMIDSLR